MMKKLLLLLTVLFVSIGMMAGVVTQQQALQKAKAFMQGKKIQTGQLRMAAGSSSGASSYYVFNTEGKDGFVIVSGDDRTDAILGYADSGEMDLTKLPENVKAWLDGYDRQIKALGDAQVNSKPRTTMAPVEYLIKTQWNQGNPYNQQCPEYNGKLCVTGCVATAMAQVMYYYKYPTDAVNGVSAYTTRGGLSVPELGSTTFDWANMRTTYSGGESTTDASAQAVANLMRYCGQLVEMDYNPKGSGASTEDIPRMKAWGYTDAAVVYRSSYADQETWESVIHSQLEANRPVLYGGNTNNGGGHQFICDGYDDNGLFHINWGWGGNCDGYFLLTVLNPDINQVGYNYNEDENYINQDAVINLQPNNGTMPVPSLEGTEFTSKTVEGVEMNFVITFDDATNGTCAVSRHNDGSYRRCIDTGYTGEVTIPSTVSYGERSYQVTEIGTYAFEDCEMTSLKIPSSVKYIRDSAISWCYGLTTLNIPAGVTSISPKALSYSRKISELTVDANSQTFEDAGCNVIMTKGTGKLVLGLKCSTIPASAKEIGEYAFQSVQNMNITIPKNIETIGAYAFGNCDGSVFTVEHETPIGIHQDAFEGASWSNMVLKVPAGAKSLYQDAPGWSLFQEKNIFEGDEGIEFSATVNGMDMWFTILSDNDKTVKVGRLAGSSDNNAIDKNTQATSIGVPETVNYKGAVYTVTAVGDYAFCNISSMQQISLPSSIVSIGNNAFCDNYNLSALTIPENVSAIGNYVFSNCRNLTTLTVDPNNMKYDSRDNCNAVIEKSETSPKLIAGTKNTVIPASVKEIGEGAFINVYDLKITIPVTVTAIGSGAFAYCQSSVITAQYTDLTAVSVDPWAFDGAASTWYNMKLRVPAGTKAAYLAAEGWNLFPSENILEGNAGEEFTATVSGVDMWFTILDDNAKTVKVGRFAGSYSNTAVNNSITQASITITEKVPYNGDDYTVTAIGSYAFCNMRNLQIINMPETVTEIGNYAFEDCNNLRQAKLPSAVTTLGDYAFAWCNSLTSITIPKSFSSMGNDVFYGCTSLSSLTVEDGNQTYYGNNAIIEKETHKLILGINGTIIPEEVSEIGEGAFRSISGLKLTIPVTVTTIGYAAFAYSRSSVITVGYEDLSKVNVGSYAFDGAGESSNEMKLRVPAGMKATYLATEGWSAYLPENVLEGNAGEEFTETVSVGKDGEEKTVSMTFTILSDGDLKTVKIGPLAGGWDNTAISKQTAYTDIILPSSVVHEGVTYTVAEIGAYAFYNINQLQQLQLPATITSVGDYAFQYCHQLTSLEIPKGVTKIGSRILYGCNNIQSFTVEEGNENYEAPDGCNALIEKATHTLLSGTRATKKIPDTVVEIAAYAFEDYSDLTISIPTSVTKIGDFAFGWCGNSTFTVAYQDPMPVSQYAFRGAGSNGSILRVPDGTKAKYLAVEGWKEFGEDNIMEGNAGEEFTEPLTVTLTEDNGDVTEYNVDVTFTVTGSDGEYQNVKVGPLNGNYSNSAINNQTIKEGSVITIPESIKHNNVDYRITAIGDYAFRNKPFSKIVLPASITTIGECAFQDCSRLTELKIPASVTSIGRLAFRWCFNLELSVDPGNETYKVSSNALIETATKTLVAGTSKTTEIPVGTEAIGEYAFYNMSNLNLAIPASVKSIGYYAFGWCYSSVFTVESNIPAVCDEWAFEGADEGNYILKVPAGSKKNYLAAIGWNKFLSENVFEGNEGMEFTAWIDGVPMIFTVTDASSDIQKVKLGRMAGSESAIDYSQDFYRDMTLPIEIPSSVKFEGVDYQVTAVGAYGLYYTPFSSVTLPETITKIGDYAFSENYNLVSMTIPSGVTSIGNRVFAYSSNLTTLTVDAKNAVYDSRNNCNAIIEKASHKLVVGIKGTVIPSTVTEIGEYAFANVSGLEITIPETVTYIDHDAFSYCNNLVLTVVNKTPLDVGYDAFWGVQNNNGTLRVPTGSKDAYSNADEWYYFPTIVEYDDSYKKGDANGDGIVDVADVVAVVNYILGKASGNFNEVAANINGDDVVDVADVVGIVNIILGKSYARGDEAVLDEFTDNDRLRLTKSDHLLTISLDNNGSYVAAQFDVRIPEGQTIESVIINKDRAQGHQAVYAEIGENLYRVVVYTLDSETFAGHSGELLSIRFADAAEGVEIDNIKFVTRNMGIKTFALLNGETTGMAALGLMQEPADVYSLNGRLVKKQATSLEGLPKGVYIIRGRKVVK